MITRQSRKKVYMDTKVLDALAAEYREDRENYEKASEVAKKLHAKMKASESKLVNALVTAGKSKYYVDKIGLFRVEDRLTFSVPKNSEDIQKFLSWIAGKYGEDYMRTLIRINHQTLNSVLSKEEDVIDKDTNIIKSVPPGLSMPTSSKVLKRNSDRSVAS